MSKDFIHLSAHRSGEQFTLKTDEGLVHADATRAFNRYFPFYIDQVGKLIDQNQDGSFDFELHIPKAIEHPKVRELVQRDALNGMIFQIEKMLVPFVIPQLPSPLFPFQERGVEFLCSGTRRILADDMGLGKSLQAITAIRTLLMRGDAISALIVCPKTLVFNWLAEINRWDPSLATNVLLPKKVTSHEIWKTRFGRSHIVITSYDHLRENSDAIPIDVDILIADEAHRVRNLSSQISQTIAIRHPKFLWFLSGTPVERDSEDLASLLALLAPEKFTLKYGKLQHSILRRMAATFVLRRAKSDVLQELPAHTEIVETIQLSPDQFLRYKEVQTIKSSNYLEKFSKLRSICDFEPKTKSSSKLERVIELLSDIRSNRESAIVFSFWVEPLDELQKRLKALGWEGVCRISAELDAANRSIEVEKFRSVGGVLLASGKIGAEGLTLTEANHVLFLNRWWNPSANDQATDRVRRIGQKSKTFSYYFVAAGTIEERITSLLEEKSSTIEELIERLRDEGEL